RILAYAPDRVSALPASVDDLVKPEWKGRLGIAPTNASFQAFVTAMIEMRGEAATEKWLRGIVANSPKYFEKNSLIVEAIDSGEIDAGLVNHYYIYEVSEELGRKINVENHYFEAGDVGNLVNASGVGVIRTSKKQELSNRLVEYLLSVEIQKRFVADVHEYSVVDPSLKPDGLIALSEVRAPKVKLADLADLQRTQRLLIKVGLL
ncbi:MAG: ABC transporter substrate-binding protein, partial [Actinomycetota bacterium]